MSEEKNIYNRINSWAKNLSRLEYSSFIGATACFSVLIGGLPLGKLMIIPALAVGFLLGSLSYAINPVKNV